MFSEVNMVVEEMISSDYDKFVQALNKEIPLGTSFKVFNTADQNFYKVICFYLDPRDIRPIAILKLNNEKCEFSDEFSNLDSKRANSIWNKFLSSYITSSTASI